VDGAARDFRLFGSASHHDIMIWFNQRPAFRKNKTKTFVKELPYHTMMRFSVALVCPLLLTIVIHRTVHVHAITYGGVADNGEHPMVGLIWDCPVGKPPSDLDADCYPLCTGTLVEGADDNGNSVLLTAAHCLSQFESADYDEYAPYVTFDEEPNCPQDEPPFAGCATNIEHDGSTYDIDSRFIVDFDIAVIYFGERIKYADGTEMPHATIAPMNELTRMKKNKTIRTAEFTTVGAGDTRASRNGGYQGIEFNMNRRKVSPQFYQSLSQRRVSFTQNQNSDSVGGTCFGDSGGPHFLADTKVIVSITSSGDGPCKNLDKTYRVESKDAYEFLAGKVVLPGV
jgi:hypothetical protein